MRRADLRLVRRPGFTLIELMAALMLSGLVLLGAHRLLDQLGDGRDRLRAASTGDAARINRTRLLRELVAHAELNGDSGRRLVGAARSASFASMCLAPAGWLERCVVSLTLDMSGDSSVLEGTLDGKSLSLWNGRGNASLAYFEKGRGWLREWSSSLALPSAVAIVTASDTLILPIGATP